MLSRACRVGRVGASAVRAQALRPTLLAQNPTDNTAIFNQHNLQRRNFISVVEKYARALKEFGLRDSLWKLYTVGDIKFGKLMGEDQFGTKYYEDLDSPYGQHRWAEYKFEHFPYDASQIPADWHAWLHHFTDKVPADQKPKDEPILQNNVGSHAAYTHHVGGVQSPWEENQTGARSRGYGVGSLMTKPGEPEREYLQPNHPLKKVKRARHNYEPWRPSSEASSA